MAIIFGLVFAIGAVATILFQFFISGRLYHKYGNFLAIYLLPVALSIGTTALYFVQSLLVLVPFVVIGLKVSDTLFRGSQESGSASLYKHLRSGISIQMFMDGFLEPCVKTCAGLILLLAFSSENIDIFLLNFWLWIIAGGWLLNSFLLNYEYRQRCDDEHPERQTRQATRNSAF